MQSYLLLAVDKMSKEEVKKYLESFEYTVEAIGEVNGRFNIIARINTDNEAKLRNFISDHVDALDAVQDIRTIII